MSAYSSDIDSGPSWPVEATRRMNRMYRRQRHIYNATRRYYLLGRDRLISGLRPEAGASVLEIGCGTGRNLVLAARLHRKARIFRHRWFNGNADVRAISHFPVRLGWPDSRRAWRL